MGITTQKMKKKSACCFLNLVLNPESVVLCPAAAKFGCQTPIVCIAEMKNLKIKMIAYAADLIMGPCPKPRSLREARGQVNKPLPAPCLKGGSLQYLSRAFAAYPRSLRSLRYSTSLDRYFRF